MSRQRRPEHGRCASPDCNQNHGIVQSGRFLCNQCVRDLRRDIHETGNGYNQLMLALEHTKSPREKVSGRGDIPLPIRDIVAEVRTQMRHDLAWWCGHVAHLRGLRGVPDPYRPTAMAMWLSEHVDWLAGHPDAVNAKAVFAEQRKFARQLRDIPPDRTRFPLGPCPENLPGQEEWRGQCPGIVWAYIPTDLTERRAFLACKKCGTQWRSGWAEVGRRILRRLRKGRNADGA